MINNNTTNNNTTNIDNDFIVLTPEKRASMNEGLVELQTWIEPPIFVGTMLEETTTTIEESFGPQKNPVSDGEVPAQKVFELLKEVSNDPTSNAYQIFEKIGLKKGIEAILEGKNSNIENMESSHLYIRKFDQWFLSSSKGDPSTLLENIDNTIVKISDTALTINYKELFHKTESLRALIIENKDNVDLALNGLSLIGPLLAYRMVLKTYVVSAYPHSVGLDKADILTRSKEVRTFALFACPVIVGTLMLMTKFNPLVSVSYAGVDKVSSISSSDMSYLPLFLATVLNKIPN